jgi:hypothetical protein
MARAQSALCPIAIVVAGCSADAPLDVDRSGAYRAPDAGAERASSGTDDDVPAPEGTGPHFEKVDEDFNTLIGATVTHAEFFCECEQNATSGPEFDACVDSYVQPYPPPLLLCTKQVLSHSDAAVEALACERDNAEQYIDCLLESTCLDFGHITGCEVDRIVRDTECGDVPYDIWATDQERCYGREVPPGFECTSGESIDPQWVCDFAVDCEDGSDETECEDPHAGLSTP